MSKSVKIALAIIGIAAVLLIGSVLGISSYIKHVNAERTEAMKKEAEIVRNKIEKAIEKKYGLDFDVELPEIQGNEGFGYDVMLAKARTTTGDRFDFNVQWVISKDKLDYDTYISAKMGHEAWKIWESKLNASYGEVYGVYYMFGVNADFESSHYNELKDMKVEEILKKYPEKILVEIQFSTVVNNLDVDVEAKRIYELTRWFGEKELSGITFIVTFGQNEKKVEFLKRYKDGGSSPQRMYDDGVLINVFRIRKFEEYRTLDAIKKSLMVWRK